MEHVHIAALRPNLDALDSKQIKAVVTLIWPYSSSQRQFALLLAEPDFRLRRRNGQVRARFSSTSARALAATGVGIGDEVVLSLHGAQFVHEGAVSTPGKSIDWELVYTQTVAISVRRDGAEIANLELIDAAPTPAPRSPVKKPTAAPSPLPQWSSPAFLKRARISDGPFFEQPAYDPLADVGFDGHDQKRRRKSYRDWKAWTYAARTPSPEKEDAHLQDELQDALSSPSRPPQLPKTPISPSRTAPISAAVAPADVAKYIEEATIGDSAEGDTTVDAGELQVHLPLSANPKRPQGDIVQEGDYYSLYDGPNEAPPDSQYDFGGDTELNTEDEEDVTVPDIAAVDASTTGAATELEDESEQAGERPLTVAPQPVSQVTSAAVFDAASATEEDSDLEVIEADPRGDDSLEVDGTTIDETVPEVIEPAVIPEDPVSVTMPPPSLPALQTDFAMNTGVELLTPIGKEPSSPNLKAVDSATLPLPSPFPGEQGASYFEHISAEEQVPLDGPSVQEEPAAESDADYIMESSFFSSIHSTTAVGLHQDHETAFTPLRFTFGTDGAGWSRPLELSSPPPEAIHTDVVHDKFDRISSPSPIVVETEPLAESAVLEQSQVGKQVSDAALDDDLEDAVKVPDPSVETADAQSATAPLPANPTAVETNNIDSAPEPSRVILLSSDVESDQSEEEREDEDEDEVMADLEEPELQEEETASESENELEANKEHHSESENGEINVTQELPDSSQARKALQPVANVDHAAVGESRQEDAALDTQTTAIAPEVVNLGSPPASKSGDDKALEGEIQQESVQSTEEVDRSGLHDQAGNTSDISHIEPDQALALTDKPVTRLAAGPFGVDVRTNSVQEGAAAASLGQVAITHEPSSVAIPDTYEPPLSEGYDNREPQLESNESLPFERESESLDVQAESTDRHDRHPDVKMESVEDGSLHPSNQPETQDVPQDSGTDPAMELVNSVSDNGHKIGELQSRSVPAMAPARNTRSKAKPTAFPSDENGSVPRASTSMRHTRSKASFDSTNRDTTSPSRTRGLSRSTASPVVEATQTSPYSLRSQAKHLSPDGQASQPASVQKSPRLLPRREIDLDIVPSQPENRDLIGNILESSQELGFGYSQLSQGKYSDVGYVKDSEAGTSRSEGSISTEQNSEPVEGADDNKPAVPRPKPRPLDLSQSQRQTRSRSRSIRQQSEDVSPILSHFTPRRSPRLSRSTFSATPSPRLVRTTKDLAQVTTMDAIDEGTPLVTALRSESVTYPLLPVEAEDNIQNSPVAAPASAQQSAQQESIVPTPGDTQQTAPEPPLSFQAHQPEQSLTTPELTQAASASATLRSFDIALPSVQTQPVPHSPVLRTSPRRKPPVTDMQSLSPVQQTSDAIISPTATTPTTQPPLPTIGLSTPLAYYTPLRDLHFFLNRSSQFHSGSSPDILALVTTATTAPTRAKKGPRDHNTTLSITDPSIYPETRTVNVFRPHAAALPQADKGDVILLRAFEVHSQKRKPALRSGSESAWCVWRFEKPVWGKKRGAYGELRVREEVKGPEVERGQGEWGEVGRVRGWYTSTVKGELEREKGGVYGDEKGKERERSGDKGVEVQVEEVVEE